MVLVIADKLKRNIQKRIRQGRYKSPAQVIEAGLAALDQIEFSGDFDKNELDKLIQEGEESQNHNGPIPFDQAMKKIRKKISGK
jgi:Arc/MetJ-type ribon-helix-helix transcriptional regulator